MQEIKGIKLCDPREWEWAKLISKPHCKEKMNSQEQAAGTETVGPRKFHRIGKLGGPELARPSNIEKGQDRA